MSKTFNKKITTGVLISIIFSIFILSTFEIKSIQAQVTNLEVEVVDLTEADNKAKKLEEAIEGGFLGLLGPDKETIFNILEGTKTQEEKNFIVERYKANTGNDLVADLKSELSSSDYVRALAGLKESVLYSSDQMIESAQKQFEETKTKLEQGESIETDAERRIEESRIRDIQKQSVKVFQENAVEQKKPSEFVPLAPEFLKAIGDDADKNLSSFFNGLFTFGIVIAGFLAVVMIAIGGIQYMSTDAVSGKGEGRERITYALMGLLLILFSWILLNTINPDILNFNLF